MKKIYIAIWLTIFSWPLLGRAVNPAHENNSTTISGMHQPAQIKKKDEPGDNVVIIVLSVVVFLAFVIGITVFIVYRRKVKGKLAQDSKPQDNVVTLQHMDIIPATSTLIASESNTPNQTDGTQRTFPYPIPRRRLSSSDSTTPLLKYRNGSYRSRFSSGLSSRIDSNIAEGKEKGRRRLFRFVRTTGRRMAAKPIKSLTLCYRGIQGPNSKRPPMYSVLPCATDGTRNSNRGRISQAVERLTGRSRVRCRVLR